MDSFAVNLWYVRLLIERVVSNQNYRCSDQLNSSKAIGTEAKSFSIQVTSNASCEPVIGSPMPRGSGAILVHQSLANKISGYEVFDFHPYWTLFPLALPFLGKAGSSNIIHTTPDYALFFKKKNVPLIVTFHNLVLDSFMRPYSSFLQRLHYATDLRLFTKKALESVDVVTSVSHFTARMVRQELEYQEEIRVIYNGVDTTEFKPSKKSKPQKIKVLFSGNLTRRKGANLLPLIAERLGKGIEIIYTQGLQPRRSSFNSEKLRSIGRIPHHEMPGVYNAADILLFPTVREGFGLAAAEAMACGLPVVATDCSSLPELIDHEHGGFLCPIDNADEFADKINLLAESPKLRIEMGEYNRAKVEKQFTVERMVSEYKSLFEEVLSDR